MTDERGPHRHERLARLEAQYELLAAGQHVIGADVKVLLSFMTHEQATRVEHDKSRASTGTWVRAYIPWFIALVTGGSALYNSFLKEAP